MKIELPIDNKCKTLIYGAGNNATILAKYLCLIGADFYAFIISEGKNKTKIKEFDKEVFYLSELGEISGANIMVAVGEQFWEEVKKELSRLIKDNSGLNIQYITYSQIMEMKRLTNPIKPYNFLESAYPGGNLMGCDRGLSLSRYYIGKFLDEECRNFDFVKKTYEVGENKYSKIFFPDAEHKVLNYAEGIDLTIKETLPKEEFDLFICTQVYNFIYDVKKAIEGSFYTLKPGGILIATVAGNISQVSRSDMKNYGDYWRFTYLGIQKLVGEVFGEKKVAVKTFGNAMSTTAYIQGMCYEDIPNPDLLDEVDPEYALVIGIVARK